MFHIGQRVICVDAKGTHVLEIAELQERAIYVVRWTGSMADFKYYCDSEKYAPNEAGVRITGIVRGTEDFPFAAWRFRPLIERKTDISVFEEILRSTRAREDA